MLRAEVQHIFRTWRPIRTSNKWCIQWITKTRIRIINKRQCAMTSKVKAQGCDVTLCVWQVLANKSRRKSSRNTENDSNNAHQFQGQRSIKAYKFAHELLALNTRSTKELQLLGDRLSDPLHSAETLCLCTHFVPDFGPFRYWRCPCVIGLSQKL